MVECLKGLYSDLTFLSFIFVCFHCDCVCVDCLKCAGSAQCVNNGVRGGNDAGGGGGGGSA